LKSLGLLGVEKYYFLPGLKVYLGVKMRLRLKHLGYFTLGYEKPRG